MRRLVALVVACACVTFAPARAADLAGTYAALHPALVFINSGNKHGTGFIVSSNASQSLIVTANHVVSGTKKIAINVNDDPHVTLEATIVKADAENDLALVAIRRGGLTTVRIGADSPPVGASIAIAGYPPTSVQFLESQNELKPELATGTITAVRVSGAIIQHSAASESGDSGGPLFLADSGDVVGVVKGKALGGAVGYVAVGGAALRAFLQSASVSFDNGLSATTPQFAARPQGPSSLVLTDHPGAHRFCGLRSHEGQFMQNAQSTVNGNLDYGTAIEAQIAQKIGAIFSATVSYVGDDPFGLNPPDRARVAQIAKAGNCVAVVRAVERWRVDNTAPFAKAIEAGVVVQVLDYHGVSWFVHVKTKEQRRVFPFNPSDLQNGLSDLANQAIDGIAADVASPDGSAAVNFARYGIPMPSGSRNAFFAISPPEKGAGNAVVSWVAPIGTAALAGLQRGDTVLSVNGTATSGLDADHLRAVVRDATTFDVVVHGADGRDVHVRFDPQDIRWYITHVAGT
jgi:S1-C subfamily serine protease